MSKNAGNIVLEAKNVVYYYKANKGKKVLDYISYGFEIGKMYAILGPSGSGKTTFLSLLAGLDSPTDGGIYYEGVNIRKKGLHNYRKKNMSLVFQNYNLIDYLTPEENVMLVLSGMSDEQQLIDNTAYMREFRPLDERERAAIARVVEELAAMPTIACTKCRYCVEGCPKKIPIPDVFEDYNMTVQFGINETNRGSYRRHTADGGSANVCIRCGKCEGQCPQHLPIRDLLVKVAETFAE